MTRPPTETERLALFAAGALVGRLAVAALRARDRRRHTPPVPSVPSWATHANITIHTTSVADRTADDTAADQARRTRAYLRHLYGADRPTLN